jgi:hypothetical protein
MENEKITIPEDLQQICRDFAAVAIKHELYYFNGSFVPRTNWGGEINFKWSAGRHNVGENELNISTQLFVNTKVIIPKP